MKHTQGPWLIWKESDYHLFIAAPELLEACEMLAKAHSMSAGYMDGDALLMLNDATIMAKAAIAKAKGE